MLLLVQFPNELSMGIETVRMMVEYCTVLQSLYIKSLAARTRPCQTIDSVCSSKELTVYLGLTDCSRPFFIHDLRFFIHLGQILMVHKLGSSQFSPN